MSFLFRKYNIGLTITLISMITLSGCENANTNEQRPTVKVVEAESNVSKADSVSNEAQSRELVAIKTMPAYYNTYKISLDVNPETRGVSGVEKISYKNTTGKDLKRIYFHLYLNAFSSTCENKPYFNEFEEKIFKYGKDTGLIDIKSVHINNEKVIFSEDETILKIELPQILKENEETEITLQFDSYIPKIAHRTGANDKAIWLGNYIPILCEYDKSGWRTDPYYPAGDPFYSDISNYEVKVTAPKEYEVIGTGDEVITEDGINNITTLSAEMVREFALAISRDYKVKTIKTQNDVNINFYYYSNDVYNINDILKVAEKSINYYSDKLGNYSYKELDIVETDLFFNGGMEYPAFIMVDSSYIKKSSSINSIVHEIGHQWFYNIIGNDQINEAWLDEGLNSYVQQKVLNQSEDIDKKLIEEYNLLKDNLKDVEQKSLNLTLGQYKDWNSYYNTQYIRGKIMIYSLNKKMGNELFDTFLKVYYKKYSFKTVTTEDFINTAEEVYGSDLSYFFEKWINYNTIPELEIGGNKFEDSIYLQ